MIQLYVQIITNNVDNVSHDIVVLNDHNLQSCSFPPFQDKDGYKFIYIKIF